MAYFHDSATGDPRLENEKAGETMLTRLVRPWFRFETISDVLVT
jgi:hypothetical protein